MPSYTFLSGEIVGFPEPTPEVGAFLARAKAAAADPSVSVAGMVELVYGPENPLLDRFLVPGRPMVTRAVFDNPIFQVLTDLIGVKRVQLGELDMGKVAEDYTMTVGEAAEQLGITPAAVRLAITANKLDGMKRNGEWYIRPAGVAAYKVSNRGRKRVEPSSGPALVRGVIGSEPGHSLLLRVFDVKFEREGKDGHQIVGHIPAGWTSALVRVNDKTAGTLTCQEIEPAVLS